MHANPFCLHRRRLLIVGAAGLVLTLLPAPTKKHPDLGAAFYPMALDGSAEAITP
jgi:hypothetical protein